MSQLTVGTMDERYGIFVGSYFLITLILNVAHCSDGKLNLMNITKELEARISPNATGSESERTAVIQHGNNVFIKPKFIIGSPFTSYKQENKPDGCCDHIQITSKLPGEETSIGIGRPPMLPEVILPPRYPIIVEKPSSPPVIPKPPELPPIILPKLPIEIIIKNPIIPNFPNLIPFPNQPVIVPHLCPPMVKCIAPERESPSIGDIFKVICDKLKNLLTIPSRIDLTNLMTQEEIVSVSDVPPAFPTICAQSIIAERVVPNIVRIDDDVKVLMSQISPSQFTGSGIYRK